VENRKNCEENLVSSLQSQRKPWKTTKLSNRAETFKWLNIWLEDFVKISKNTAPICYFVEKFKEEMFPIGQQ
jgi:hypothetical protein